MYLLDAPMLAEGIIYALQQMPALETDGQPVQDNPYYCAKLLKSF